MRTGPPNGPPGPESAAPTAHAAGTPRTAKGPPVRRSPPTGRCTPREPPRRPGRSFPPRKDRRAAGSRGATPRSARGRGAPAPSPRRPAGPSPSSVETSRAPDTPARRAERGPPRRRPARCGRRTRRGPPRSPRSGRAPFAALGSCQMGGTRAKNPPTAAAHRDDRQAPAGRVDPDHGAKPLHPPSSRGALSSHPSILTPFSPEPETSTRHRTTRVTSFPALPVAVIV